MIGCIGWERSAPKSLLARLRDRLLGPVVRINTARAFGTDYCLIEISRCHDPAAAWRGIQAALPDHISCFLGQEDLPTPDSLAPPDIVGFERVLLTQTACALIEGSGIPVNRRVCGLYDPTGDYSSLLPKLLTHCSSVQVCTGNPRHYQAAARQALEEMGAPVLVCEDASFRDCALLLCPGDREFPFFPRCPVLSLRRLSGRLVFSEPRILENGSLPSGIDSHLFVGVLFALEPNPAIQPVAASVLLGEARISLERAQVLLARALRST